MLKHQFEFTITNKPHLHESNNNWVNIQQINFDYLEDLIALSSQFVGSKGNKSGNFLIIFNSLLLWIVVSNAISYIISS